MAFDQTRTEPLITATTVGSSSALLVAADARRTKLIIQNVATGTTNNVGLTTIRQGVAALNTAGSLMLVPLGSLILDGVACTSGLNAISTAGSCPVTIWEF